MKNSKSSLSIKEDSLNIENSLGRINILSNKAILHFGRMKSKNEIEIRSYEFSLSVIRVYKKLKYESNEFILSKQLLRSGTSIGANIAESGGAYTPKDFMHKINIAYKEARETKYWISLLKDSQIIPVTEAKVLLKEVDIIIRILASILLTLRKKNT